MSASRSGQWRVVSVLLAGLLCGLAATPDVIEWRCSESDEAVSHLHVGEHAPTRTILSTVSRRPAPIVAAPDQIVARRPEPAAPARAELRILSPVSVRTEHQTNLARRIRPPDCLPT
jgi:hypothetical protein